MLSIIIQDALPFRFRLRSLGVTNCNSESAEAIPFKPTIHLGRLNARSLDHAPVAIIDRQ